MSSPFVPTPFGTPVVNPAAVSVTRRIPYISVSEYRFAPTAVGTTDLVPGSPNQAADSAASLAQVIERASSWMDTWCFHTADGTLAASVSVESAWVKVKTNGDVPLISKYKPILDVQGVAVGPSPGNLTNIGAITAGGIWIDDKVIWVPGVWNLSPATSFPIYFGRHDGTLYAVWTYTNGFPVTALAANALAGATSIQVQPTNADGTGVSGVYAANANFPGSQLTIHDSGSTEVVTVASSYAGGTTLPLAAPLQYAHTVPASPDMIRVAALPWALEQACISVTSILIKTRGTRAQILPMLPGQQPGRQALAQAGALDDWEIARRLLHPYQTVFLGNAR